MGKASRRTQLRRAHSAAMEATDEQLRSRPDIQAEIAAQLADDDLQARITADLPAQAARLARAGWRQRRAGADGLGHWQHRRQRLSLIHNASREPDGHLWGHVSVACAGNVLPGWYLVRDAARLVYPDRPGLIVVAPETAHVNLAEVMHVWYCLDGDPVPDFARFGTL